MKWILIAASFLSVASAQTESGISREGSYWVQTVTGTVVVAAPACLHLDSIGPVVVRGQNGADLTWSVRKRATARNETEARRLLAQIVVKLQVMGSLVHFVVSSPAGRQVMADVDLKAPKNLQQVKLRTNVGTVEAYDLDGEVDTETGGGVIRMDRIGRRASARSGGGELSVGTVSGPVRAVSGGGSIRIENAGGETWIESAGGSVSVNQVWGPLHVATGGGNISVTRASGTVTARTAGGGIEVQQAGGSVLAQTSGGGIEIGKAAGVKCESSAGAIRVRSVGGALNASTASGGIIAEFLGGQLLDSVLSTAVGDVTVFIPSNIAVTVRAQNESGSRAARIVSDFPEVRIQPAAFSMAVAEGAINGGGPVLRVFTANGAIYLRRRK